MLPPPNTSKIVFESEYINFAWSYMHSGWLMDSAGNIYTYNRPVNWNFPDSTGTITEIEVEANLSKTQLSPTKIDKQVLKEKINLIAKASRGEVTPRQHAMYDAGTGAFYVYVYRNGQYTRILIHLQGDWESTNKSPEAQALYNWLSSLKLNE
jgi:hypothetical protein